jgi:hypothetical protein
MSDQPPFEPAAAHRYFSAHCFNSAWDLIDKSDRTPEEDIEMLHRAIAGLWHWTQRADCSATNRSIGLWQVSRVYAVLGQADNARRYAELCRSTSESAGVEPFYLGYAYEALARAEVLAGNAERVNEYLGMANRLAGKVADEESKTALLRDLETIIQKKTG